MFCPFLGYTGEITAGVAGVFLIIVMTISLVLYRNWKYEQELDSLLWKIDFKEIVMPEADKENNGQKLKRVRLYPHHVGTTKNIEIQISVKSPFDSY